MIYFFFHPCIRQTLKGPDDTVYAGGVFEVDIVIPNDYPFSPPKMKFITKGLHKILTCALS